MANYRNMELINRSKSGSSAITEALQSHGTGFVSKENLPTYLSGVSIEDIPWAVNYLVSKLVDVSRKKEDNSKPHTWSNYQLSPEIEALSSFERKSLPDD